MKNISDITMQFESNNKGPAMNCKKFIQLPTYCFDQAICNLLWLQNHELKSQKEQLKTKISMKLHVSISLLMDRFCEIGFFFYFVNFVIL